MSLFWNKKRRTIVLFFSVLICSLILSNHTMGLVAYASTAERYPEGSFKFNMTIPAPGGKITNDYMTWYGKTPPASGSATVYDSTGKQATGVYACDESYQVRITVSLPVDWANSTYSYLPISLNGEELPTQRQATSGSTTLRATVQYVLRSRHNLQHIEKVPATCTENGVEEHYCCSVCKRLFRDSAGQNRVTDTELVIPKGHSIIHVDAKAPTCTVDGFGEHYECELCGKYFTDAEGKNETTSESLLIPKSHKIRHFQSQEPGCTKDGCKEHYKCDVCGKYFTDGEGKNETTYEDIVIPKSHKLSHVESKEPTCTEDGMKEYYECSVCKNIFADEQGKTETDKASLVIEKLGHDWEKIIEKKATTDEEGIINYVCRRDPEHKTTERFIYHFSGRETVAYGSDAVITLKRSVNDEETYDLFVSVEVDGKQLEKDDFEVKPGSLILTLKNAYLSTLPAGAHKLTVNLEDGSADLSFALRQAETPVQSNEFNGVFLVVSGIVLLLIIAGVVTAVVAKKVRQQP